MKSSAEDFLREGIVSAVETPPYDTQRQGTKNTGKNLGLNIIRSLDYWLGEELGFEHNS